MVFRCVGTLFVSVFVCRWTPGLATLCGGSRPELPGREPTCCSVPISPVPTLALAQTRQRRCGHLVSGTERRVTWGSGLFHPVDK